jgi:hypothetical protein
MNRAILIVIVAALLLSTIIGLSSFSLGRAQNTTQFYPTNAPPTLLVERPNNCTIQGYLIPLNVTLFYVTSDYNSSTGMRIDEQWVNWLGYSLDDKPPTIFRELGSINSPIRWITTLNFTGIDEGQHKINVIAGFAYTTTIGVYEYNFTFDPIYFGIYNTPLVVSNQSPENRTYPTNNVPLLFSVNRVTSWVGYNLDKQLNQTITGNLTLTGLSDGGHSVIVYANDTYGNMGASNIVFFTVSTQRSLSPTPSFSIPEFPAGLILFAFLIITALVVAVVKRKNG